MLSLGGGVCEGMHTEAVEKHPARDEKTCFQTCFGSAQYMIAGMVAFEHRPHAQHDERCWCFTSCPSFSYRIESLQPDMRQYQMTLFIKCAPL